ncbi:MAG: hypothetical protein D6834_01160, partial [Aquificota bacterium]
MNKNEIVKLSDREHVLKRPNMYIGGLEPIKEKDLFFDFQKQKFEYKEIEYVPGLLKIINEIIDNSIDEAIKTNFKYANKISVKINDNEIKVEDNGRGISTDIEKTTKLPQAVVAFTHAKSGSNFGNDDERKSIGMNGVGAFCTAVFSKKFKVETKNNKELCKISLKNNLNNVNFHKSKSRTKDTYTKISFEPDLERFKLKEIKEEYKSLVFQRLLMLSQVFPTINFKFNGKTI